MCMKIVAVLKRQRFENIESDGTALRVKKRRSLDERDNKEGQAFARYDEG